MKQGFSRHKFGWDELAHPQQFSGVVRPDPGMYTCQDMDQRVWIWMHYGTAYRTLALIGS